MSDSKSIEGAVRLTQDQVENVGGGECTATELLTFANGITAAYESLVSFTSHVIERVSNAQ